MRNPRKPSEQPQLCTGFPYYLEQVVSRSFQARGIVKCLKCWSLQDSGALNISAAGLSLLTCVLPGSLCFLDSSASLGL